MSKNVKQEKNVVLEKYQNIQPVIKFISYSGEYPILCSGLLIFSIDGEIFQWHGSLCSGGQCYIEECTSGAWTIDFPNDFPKILEPFVTDMVNENILHGCCGGRM